MKKYYQALLAITAAVSIISLLFYRHEYNKLRYVLEVFNYFGKPNLKNVDSNCTNVSPIFTKFDMKFGEPLASWQRIDDTLYVYSAYGIRENEVEVIGFGSLGTIKDMQCVMFFETDTKPVLGNFKYIVINNTFGASNTEKLSDYGGYHFLCTHRRKKIPVGITFLTKSKANLDDAPILSVKTQPQSLNHSNTALCVIPPLTKQMHPSEMISFINFHDLIGMNNFIVYDFGIPNKFNSKLRDVSMAQNPYLKFTYTTIPWNFPFHGLDHDITRNIIQADCLYRTYNKAMYMATLSWEEYIVLKYHHSITDLMADFKKSRLKDDSYKMTTAIFCTEQSDDTSVTNLTLTILRKTRFYPSIAEKHPVYIYQPHGVLGNSNMYTRDIGKDLAVLNRYKQCGKTTNLNENERDSSILRFMEDIQNSLTFKMFIAKDTLSLEE